MSITIEQGLRTGRFITADKQMELEGREFLSMSKEDQKKQTEKNDKANKSARLNFLERTLLETAPSTAGMTKIQAKMTNDIHAKKVNEMKELKKELKQTA